MSDQNSNDFLNQLTEEYLSPDLFFNRPFVMDPPPFCPMCEAKNLRSLGFNDRGECEKFRCHKCGHEFLFLWTEPAP